MWVCMYSYCISPTGSCGGVYPIRTHGAISLPLVPDGYASWLSCHWVVEAGRGQEVELRLEESHLEDGYDTLRVCDGPVCLSHNVLAHVTGRCNINVCMYVYVYIQYIYACFVNYFILTSSTGGI